MFDYRCKYVQYMCIYIYYLFAHLFTYARNYVKYDFVSVRKRGELQHVYIICLLLNWTDIAVLFIVVCYETYTPIFYLSHLNTKRPLCTNNEFLFHTSQQYFLLTEYFIYNVYPTNCTRFSY